MDFADAKRAGDEGERLVAAELERIAPEFGLTILHDVLLSVDPMTAQLDHVVVDRFGVLVVESKVRSGARIRGTDREARWTAVYPGGKTATMQSPLRQNEQHENILRRALRDAGSPLEPDYIRSAVVFAGADLSALELDSLSRARVLDVSGVESFIRGRHDFAPNAGALDAVAVAQIAGLIRGLNRAADAAVIEKHAAGVPGHRTSKSKAAPKTAEAAKDAQNVDAETVLRVLDQLAKPSRRRRRYAREFVARLIALALLGLFVWWMAQGNGMTVMTNLVSSVIPQTTQTVAPTASVEQAKAAVMEADPSIYARLANRDNPKIEQVAQGTTFTWQYAVENGSTALVKTISVTLDANGRMVGVDIR